MKLLFMGTPDFAVPILRMLLEEGYDIAAVITQPDRPKGRKRVLTPPPVKVEAEGRHIPVFQPERLRHPDAVEQVKLYEPDLIVTAAYGQILPKSILQIPQYGCINVHGSLLPKYRGGAPIQHAIINGESLTGITIMYMAEGLDTGDMISKVEVPITDEDTAGTIFAKLSEAGTILLKETLPRLLAGEISAVPQNHAEATLAPNIKRDGEQIHWNKSSRDIFNLVRGLNPEPVAFTTWNGEPFKVWTCERPGEEDLKLTIQDASASPGTILEASKAGVIVRTGDGSIRLTRIQPAGKKAMDAAEFIRGNLQLTGTIFGV